MSHQSKSGIVVITGSNSGIGKAAAVRFAKEGWRVVMACRNLETSAKARDDIVAASHGGLVDLMQLDVSSFDSIHRFCESFKREHAKLDVLINNAGYFEHGITKYQTSPDGLELTFATNVFGPMLLTELLLDRLSASEDARVLNAGSTNLKNFFNPKREIEFDNLCGEHQGKRPYSVYKMYGDSKMALLLLTYRMAEEYRARGIKVNSVMIPATKVSKEALRRMTGIYRFIGPVIQNWNPLSLTQEEMGDVYYRICAAPDFREVTGALVDSQCRIVRPAKSQRLTPFGLIRELLNTRHTPSYANDPANIARMWGLGKEIIGRALPARAG